jgi:hypothetical protein
MLERLLRLQAVEIVATLTRTGIDRCHTVTHGMPWRQTIGHSKNLHGQKVANNRGLPWSGWAYRGN